MLDAAREADRTVGTAESLTGGLIAATLTDVPGSSESVRGGVVSYAEGVKREVLGVGRETLALCGVVSEETACAMAEGARRRLDCDVAVAVTGIAGPGGAEPGKPVGTVWIGRADAALTCARCCHFPGTREQVRLLTVRAALEFAGSPGGGRGTLAQGRLEPRSIPAGCRLDRDGRALDARHRGAGRRRYTEAASSFRENA
ncbi:MAG: CinA family protein [Eggerthellaceae bacterium]